MQLRLSAKRVCVLGGLCLGHPCAEKAPRVSKR